MRDDDPYRAPSAQLESPPDKNNDDGDILLRSPRSVGVERSIAWIVEAFHMFRKYPIAWISTGLIHFGLSMFAGFVPYLGGPLSTIISSVVLGGVMLGCAAQEFGDQYSANYVYLGFSNPGKLITLGLVYSLVSGIILAVVLGPFGLELVLGTLNPDALEQQLETNRNPIILAAVLMIPLIMASWFSIVLIALHNLSVGAALRLSFFGCLTNLLPMFVFCLALSMLFFIGVLALFVGVLVMYPIMFVSTYTAYRDIFTHEQVGVK